MWSCPFIPTTRRRLGSDHHLLASTTRDRTSQDLHQHTRNNPNTKEIPLDMVVTMIHNHPPADNSLSFSYCCPCQSAVGNMQRTPPLGRERDQPPTQTSSTQLIPDCCLLITRKKISSPNVPQVCQPSPLLTRQPKATPHTLLWPLKIPSKAPSKAPLKIQPHASRYSKAAPASPSAGRQCHAMIFSDECPR